MCNEIDIKCVLFAPTVRHLLGIKMENEVLGNKSARLHLAVFKFKISVAERV